MLENFFLNKNNNDLIKELKKKGIDNEKILDAIKKVPRKLFVNQASEKWAYQDKALPAECGQTISQPYVIAFMIDCLKLKETDQVLEVGTGTGYQTAIISHLCQEIYTIEIFSKLFKKAKFNNEKLNIKNIIYKLGNGVNGWEEKNVFDAIIVCASSEEASLKLLQSLKKNGKLIFPKKYPFGNQKLVLIKKIGENNYEKKELFDVKFVPLLNNSVQHLI